MLLLRGKSGPGERTIIKSPTAIVEISGTVETRVSRDKTERGDRPLTPLQGSHHGTCTRRTRIFVLRDRALLKQPGAT